MGKYYTFTFNYNKDSSVQNSKAQETYWTNKQLYSGCNITEYHQITELQDIYYQLTFLDLSTEMLRLLHEA